MSDSNQFPTKKPITYKEGESLPINTRANIFWLNFEKNLPDLYKDIMSRQPSLK